MSEEEIIDEIKYNILNDPSIVFSQDSSFEDIQIKANAIQGLLDLYIQEKEKNKELELCLKAEEKYSEGLNEDIKSLLNIEPINNFISKDKMRKLIIKNIGQYMSFYREIEKLIEIESLNDEVEIIEEDKEIKKLEFYGHEDNKPTIRTHKGTVNTMRIIDVTLAKKINELVDEVNKLKENNR